MEKSKAAKQSGNPKQKNIECPPPSPDNRGKGEEGAGKKDLTGGGGGGGGIYSKVGAKFLGEQYISLHTPHNCYYFLVTLQAKSHFFDLGFTPCKAEHSL